MIKIKSNIVFVLAYFLLAFAKTVNAQEQQSRRQRAEKYYNLYEYSNSAKLFEYLVDVKKPKISDLEYLANSYLFIDQYELASNWYARIFEMNKSTENTHFNYALALQQQGKYFEAQNLYHSYVKKYGINDTLRKLLLGADSAQVWMRNPNYYKLINAKKWNTPLSDFGVFPYNNKVFYASEPSLKQLEKSGMTGQNYLKIHQSVSDNNDWTDPEIIEEIFNESRYHVGPISGNVTGDKLFVTRTYTGKSFEKVRTEKQTWKKQNLELIIYNKIDDKWVEEDFPYNNVKEYSIGHAALSQDGQTLYFASNMPGGKGGVDIWYCELKSDNSWGFPKNAGENINTVGDEVFPVIDGGIMYFSSNGHVGMGGLDIFSALGKKGSWTSSKNMEYPVNSPADDFSFIPVKKSVDGEEFGYLSSNRPGGIGSDDIYAYHYKKPKINTVLKVEVKDKTNSNYLSKSIVSLYDSDKILLSRSMTDTCGMISFEIKSNQKYLLLGEYQGYLTDTLYVSQVKSNKDTLVNVVLNMQPIHTVGHSFVLENIYYDFDKYHINEEAALILNKLVATMRDNPSLKIELSSHTDSRGTNKYNQTLSNRRAKSAADYIISRGISRDRLKPVGYGESRLMNHCTDDKSCSEKDHQINRRTEVKILAY